MCIHVHPEVLQRVDIEDSPLRTSVSGVEKLTSGGKSRCKLLHHVADQLAVLTGAETHGGAATTGIPAGMSQKTLGVLDHLSVGVMSVPETYKRLKAAKRLEGRYDDGPKIGLDGKYQFNLYDPDGIRLELMNFHATEKPCCSPFTADDPTE